MSAVDSVSSSYLASGWKSVKTFAKSLKREVTALNFARQDPRCPTTAKIVALATIAYAVSPIDLIPDFIPVLGLLDDIILVPAGVALAIKLIPKEVMKDARAKALESEKLPKSWISGACVAAVWVAAGAYASYKVARAFDYL